jgi:hypothetical protein
MPIFNCSDVNEFTNEYINPAKEEITKYGEAYENHIIEIKKFSQDLDKTLSKGTVDDSFNKLNLFNEQGYENAKSSDTETESQLYESHYYLLSTYAIKVLAQIAYQKTHEDKFTEVIAYFEGENKDKASFNQYYVPNRHIRIGDRVTITTPAPARIYSNSTPIINYAGQTGIVSREIEEFLGVIVESVNHEVVFRRSSLVLKKSE